MNKYEVILGRVPEHSNVDGNPIEDELARQVSIMDIELPDTSIRPPSSHFYAFRKNGYKIL